MKVVVTSLEPRQFLTPHHIHGERVAQGNAVAEHVHAEGMLLAVHEGLVAVETPEGVWTITPGALSWIPPGLPHGARWFGMARGTSLFVRPDACQRLPATARVWQRSTLVAALIERLASASQPRLSDAYTGQLFDVLLEELKHGEATPMRLPMPQDSRLQGLANTLLDSPDDMTGIDEWALRLHMSSRTLTRKFRQETGVTLGQWRQQVRLLRAIEMLSRGESVTQVALSVGYESISAFISSFRSAFGMTPTRYFAKQH